jgi:ParB-like chromosome segregation protein Spo0J
MNEIRLLPVKQITIPNGAMERSDKPRELPYDIAETERLTPIAVRPDLAKQGQYVLISGEDRYYFAAKVLKQESIKCRVFKDMDEEEAQLAALSESVRQKRASNAERLELVRKWYRLYTKKYPESVRKKSSDCLPRTASF